MTEPCCKTYMYIWRTDKGRQPLGGYSLCLSCKAQRNDARGVPRGLYLINGKAWTGPDAQRDLCCPICRANLTDRFAGGTLILICAGEEEHNIGEMHRAMTKKAREYHEATESTEADNVWARMPQEYKDALEKEEQNA